MRSRLLAPLGLALALAVTPLASLAQTLQPLDRIVAVVNQGAIMASELEQRVEQAGSQLAGRGIERPQDQALRSQVLDRMIIEEIQLQKAEQANLSVDDTELNRTVRGIAESNDMTLEQFADALEAQGLSLAGVREEVRRELLIRELQQRRVASRVNVTDREVDRYLEQQGGNGNARYRLGHILISLPQSPSSAEVNEAQAQAQALAQQLQAGADFAELAASESDGGQALEGGDLGWRSQGELPSIFADVVPRLEVGEVSEPLRSTSGFHLVKLVEREGGAQQATIREHQARHILIETNPNRDDQRAEALAEQVRQRLVNGENFAALAQEFSDDRGSALNGGELGWVRPGQTVPAFEEAMTSLAPGEISQPVRSRFGYHIIVVDERREQDVTREAQRSQVRDTLFQRKVNDELEIWLQEIRAEAFVEKRL
ncbi:peptidylprolyl isomerase [Litchfieldella xinjiangensis]|uniref:peptidylprolyl isomerase n=1 Tax=Litchfieldella xinjiangensis TaxID=1166948 RepID=UPI0005BDA4F1|nr:peptidylprolyl isomerase [Halomonas xinjiangensis]